MRQQPIQLTEVPWNEQTPAQRQQTLQRQRLAQQQQQAAATVGADSGADRPTAAAARSAAEAGSAATAEADRVKPAAVPRSAADASAYQSHAAAYPGRSAGNWWKKRRKPPPRRKTIVADDPVRLFKGAEQAETVRAQLASKGLLRILPLTTAGTVVNPLKGKESANEMITRLKMAGHANCIRLAARGETLKIPIYIVIRPRGQSAGPLFRFCKPRVCS